jgi:hypothetical protein
MVGTVSMSSIAIIRKKIHILTIPMMISMILLSGNLIIPVHAASTTTVKVNPLSQTISYGSTFTVTILCVPNQPIKSYELKIAFNPSLLKANSVTKGNIFNAYTTFFNAGTIDNTAGTIKNIYNLILGSGSASTSGTFISISFTAKSTSGTSSINLNNVGVTNNIAYIPVAITNGSAKVGVQSTNPPVYESMSPANKSTNIPLSTSSLSLNIYDPDSEHFDYTIQTQPNVGRVSVQGTHNGTKQCTISGLKSGTTYRWYVNATDGANWKRRWYTFTTAAAPGNNLISFSAITPSDGSQNIPISTTTLSLTIKNTKGHTFNYDIRTNPNVGLKTRTYTSNGSKTCDISGLTYGTTYRWSVSCKDTTTGQWTNQSFLFTTVSNNPDGNPSGGGGSSSDENETPPVQNTPPNTPTAPTGPIYVQTGVTNYFTSYASDPDNDTIRLRFDWGDGSYSEWTTFIASNVSISISHTWMNISSYNITVIAQDEHGQNSSWSDPFNVTISQAEPENEPATVEIITSSENISTNESIQFDASYCYVPGSTIVSYEWEFGDGKKSTGKTTAYSYTTPGQYAVTLTITDNQGETYDNKIVVTVAAGAEVVAQDAMSFLSILITSGLIGIVIILILVLMLLTRGTEVIQLGKRYVTYGRKWITPLTTKITAGFKHTKTMEPKQKPKMPISPINENKLIHTSLSMEYSLMENHDQNVDDILIQKIHDKIDRL